VDWVLLGQTVQMLPPAMIVGIGVTAHDNSLLATGTFSNFQILQTDFGDAPAPYPTLLAANGPRHSVRQGYFLGSGTDGESDGQPVANADGDDLSAADDEDGVAFATALIPGSTVNIPVTASGRASGRMDRLQRRWKLGESRRPDFSHEPLYPA
jgi:hypothetical protein